MKQIKRICTAFALVFACAILLSSCSISEMFGKAGITSPATLPQTSPDTSPSSPSVRYEQMDLAGTDLSQYVKLDYKKLELVSDFKPRTITDEVIDSELFGIMVNMGYYTLDTSRRSQAGDTVEISFTGFMDGEQFDGGSSDKATILLDDYKSGYIEGFAAGLIGVKPGDTVNLDLTFPETYYSELAGKPVTFKVTVKGICKCELTDEIATVLNDGKQINVADFRVFFKSYLEDLESSQLLNGLFDQIREKLIQKAEVIREPEQQFLYYYHSYNDMIINTARTYGLDYDTYMSTLGYTDDDIRQMAHDDVKADLALYYVANSEGINITDEKYREYLEMMVNLYNSNGYNYTVEQIEETYNSYYGEGFLRRQAFEETVCNKIYEYAVISYTEDKTAG